MWIYSCFIFTGMLHQGSWDRLKAESCALRYKGQAKGSWDNKVSYLKQFISFCCYYDVADFPLQLGTHDGLTKLGGIYADLIRQQQREQEAKAL